ncbi:F-box/WD repeat-containing protein 9 [Ceratobasidium sp. 428]|nr:F-box/WD repeat-containing protein 9 [Ceratobasidium sp. 428]
MDKIASDLKRSVKKRLKKLSPYASNNPELSTASSLRDPPSIPAITATSSQLASGQKTLPLPLSAALVLQPESNDVTEPEPVPITPAPPTEQGAAHDAWLGLRAFAKVIGEGIGPFAPLKEAIGGISEVARTFELAAQNREEYQKLMTELDNLLNDLAGYFGSSTPPAMTSSIVNLTQGIKQELEVIRRKQSQSGVGGYVKSATDADQILEHYRSLQGLLQRLMLNANLDMWRTIKEQATVASKQDMVLSEQARVLSEQAMENRLSRLPNSPAAWYRSAKSSTVLRGECTPNTRVKVLQGLDQWASDSESPTVYWLNGMAGTGKTTIAYSFGRKLEHSEPLQ